MSEDEKRRAIARRIREARHLAGLSQSQVAELMGMHRPTVSEIEAGRRRVASEELTKLAELFGVSTAWLLDDSSADQQSLGAVFAARQLEKMKPEDLDRLMQIIAAIRGAKSSSG